MNIYVLADGICEDWHKGETTLELANTPSLDHLGRVGEVGFYEPTRRKNCSCPETFVVFPYFFGLMPYHNPGRAGLELFHQGVDINSYKCTSIFRVVPREYDVMLGWDAAPIITEDWGIDGVVQNAVVISGNVYVVKSPISKHRNLWAVGSVDKESLEKFFKLLFFDLGKICISVYPSLFHDFEAGQPKQFMHTTVLGWVDGPLSYALLYAGCSFEQGSYIDCKHHFFDYGRKLDDFKNRIIPKLVDNSGRDVRHIIYIKEPSSASRTIDRGEKVCAVEFVDVVVGNILESLRGSNNNIFLLSDHQSNIGVEETFAGPTLYAYARLNALNNNELSYFSERAVWQENGVILEQSELVSKLNDFICS